LTAPFIKGEQVVEAGEGLFEDDIVTRAKVNHAADVYQ